MMRKPTCDGEDALRLRGSGHPDDDRHHADFQQVPDEDDVYVVVPAEALQAAPQAAWSISVPVPSSSSIFGSSNDSISQAKVIDFPVDPARPVRPIR